MIHPLLTFLLSNTRTLPDALEIWTTYSAELRGYSFVLSVPGGNALPFPCRADFPEGGYLRSAFAHDSLWLLNDKTVRTPSEKRVAHVPIDYTVAFDSNVASYLRAWMKGSSAPAVSMLQKALQHLNQGRFNWDVIPFLLERSEAFLAGRDATEIYETALASEWLGCSDLQEFHMTGTLRQAFSRSEIEQKARLALSDWRRLLQNGQMAAIRHRHTLFLACVTKLVLLQLSSPSPTSAAEKLHRFLLFADSELSCMPQLFAIAALELFAAGGGFKPMAKVANPSPELRSRVRNVAWDFLQLQWRQEFAGNHGRKGAFHVPLFLTFDHGLAKLADAFPQRSCLYGRELTFPIFFQDFDFATLVLTRHPELEETIGKIFTVEAHQRRAARLHTNQPNYDKILAQLQSELAPFEHT